MRNQPTNYFLPAVVLAIGIAFAGWFVAESIETSRQADRFVTVKGVAEREVEADQALWPIKFTTTANELSEAQAALAAQEAIIVEFLNRNSIPADQVALQRVDVNDLAADPYRQGEIRARFIVSQTMLVESNDPQAVENASRKVTELLAQGIVLPQQWGPEGGPTYLFNRLNDIKPTMIAEATASARQAAAQFANDSGASVGAIRRANQGVFQILPRTATPGMTESSQRLKTVRVVSTIDYFLETPGGWFGG